MANCICNRKEDKKQHMPSIEEKIEEYYKYKWDMLNIVWRLIITYLMDIEAFQI